MLPLGIEATVSSKRMLCNKGVYVANFVPVLLPSTCLNNYQKKMNRNKLVLVEWRKWIEKSLSSDAIQPLSCKSEEAAEVDEVYQLEY